MANIPVFGVVGATIYASFLRFATAFRLAWFPLVTYDMAIIAKQMAVRHVELSNARGEWLPVLGAPFDYAIAGLAGTSPFWFTLLLIVASTSATIALLRWALTDDVREGHYFVFDWGGVETRSVIAGLVALAILVAVVFVFGFIVGAVIPKSDIAMLAAAAETHNGVTVTPFSAYWQVSLHVKAIVLAGVLVFLWIHFRLFMLQPAVVDTNRLAFATAWRASKGQVFRLFFVQLLTTIYMFLILLAAGLAVVMTIGNFSYQTTASRDSGSGSTLAQLVQQGEFNSASQLAAYAAVSVTGAESVTLTVPVQDGDLPEEHDGRGLDLRSLTEAQPMQVRNQRFNASFLGPLFLVFVITISAFMTGRAYRARKGE